MLQAWWLGFAANLVVALAYLAIAAHVLGHILRSHQTRLNPLAIATGLIFATCGMGHAVHAYHAWDPAVAAAQRTMLGDWHMWAVDGATAIAALWYWSLRNRYAALVRGAALFEDMRVRQRQALEIHDNVVQGIVKAKLSHDLGDAATTQQQLEATLRESRRIMDSLLGDATEGRPLAPGDLRRSAEGR